jgi:hypothetical protein
MADFAIISYVDVVKWVAISPTIFGVLIIFSFYSLAKKFMRFHYAALAAFVYYSQSLILSTYSATNGAAIANSLNYPYISGLASQVLLPIFLLSLFQLYEDPTRKNMMLSGLILSAVLLIFHFLIIIAFGTMLIFLAISLLFQGAQKVFRLELTVTGIAFVFSSPYILHILSSGLPTNTGAFSTYASLSIYQYINNVLHLPLFLLLLFDLILIVFSNQVRAKISEIPSNRLLILLSLIIFLIIGTEAWRFGIVLINDRFAYYLIGPTSIIAVMVLSVFDQVSISTITAKSRKHILTIISTLLILASLVNFPLVPGLMATTPNVPLDLQEAALWLRKNANKCTLFSDPVSGFIVSGLSNLYIIAYLPTISDYYVSDLDIRLQDQERIFNSRPSEFIALTQKYNITYFLVKMGDISTDSIFLTPYVALMFPMVSYAKGGSAQYDFDGDGLPETFDKIFGNTAWTYLLKTNGSNVLNLRYLFNSKTRGPVYFYVNDHLLATLYSSDTNMSWTKKQIIIPNEILLPNNTVRIENRDPNEWYLDYLGFGPIPSNITKYEHYLFRIYQIKNTSILRVGGAQNYNNNTMICDMLNWNGDSKSYYLYSESSNNMSLVLHDFFHEKGTIGPIEIFINGARIGYLAATNQGDRERWLTHRIFVLQEVLRQGWNNITLINNDRMNNWYLNYLEISYNLTSFYYPPLLSFINMTDMFNVLSWNGTGNNEKTYYLYSFEGNETKLILQDLFHEHGTIGPIEISINDKFIGNLTCYDQNNRGKWLSSLFPIPSGTLRIGWNEIHIKNLDMANNWYTKFIKID